VAGTDAMQAPDQCRRTWYSRGCVGDENGTSRLTSLRYWPWPSECRSSHAARAVEAEGRWRKHWAAVVARAAAATGAGVAIGVAAVTGWRWHHGCCWSGHASSSVVGAYPWWATVSRVRLSYPYAYSYPAYAEPAAQVFLSAAPQPAVQREVSFRPGSMFCTRRRESAVAVGLGPRGPPPPPAAPAVTQRPSTLIRPPSHCQFSGCVQSPPSLLLSQSGAR